MSHPETCRIAATPADYQRYGIARGDIAAWEDGFRTRPGGPGTFEWWYFDAVLDDGAKRILAQMAGFDGTYMRFTGAVGADVLRQDQPEARFQRPSSGRSGCYSTV